MNLPVPTLPAVPVRSGIYIPSINRTVSISTYCNAIRRAKANPDAFFTYTLNGWGAGTGADIMREFRQVRNERITAGRRITR